MIKNILSFFFLISLGLVYPRGDLLYDPTSPAQTKDRVWYQLSAIELKYAETVPSLPTTQELMKMKVKLCKQKDCYMAIEKGCSRRIEISLDELSDRSGRIDQSGLKEISSAVSAFFERRGLIGVFVDFDPKKQVCSDPKQGVLEDRLLFTIYVARCGKVRTVSSDDLPNSNRYNALRFRWIRAGSPIVASDKKSDRSLLKQHPLDEYAYYLNRYPGRRVDIQIRPLQEQPGLVGIDYVIHQNKPWRFYAAINNNAPKDLGSYTAAAGFIHTQALLEDATFRIDWSQIIRQLFHSTDVSYDFPVRMIHRSRMKFLLGYHRYSSKQFAEIRGDFIGKQYKGSATFTNTFYQSGLFFADWFAEAQYRYISIEKAVGGLEGRARFLQPRFGFHFDKTTAYYTAFATIGASSSVNGFLVGSRRDLQAIAGIEDEDAHWFMFDYSSELSYYVTPPKWKGGAFVKAHEIYLALKGQYAFRYRLISQLRAVVGGEHSVRGYPPSFVSGDNVIVLNAEYRFHLPRTFKVISKPKTRFLKQRPFRANPQQHATNPDWDLMLFGFVDAANVYNNKRTIELNPFLLSTGAGVQVSVYDNLFLKAQVGVILKEVIGLSSETAKKGDSRAHVSATVVF